MSRSMLCYAVIMAFALISPRLRAQDCSTCSADVLESLQNNSEYQRLVNEGTQSGIYKASKMQFRQTISQCGSCMSQDEIDAAREAIAQLDELIAGLATDNSSPTYDATDKGTTPYQYSSPSSTNTQSLQPRPTPTSPRSSPRTMHAGNAN